MMLFLLALNSEDLPSSSKHLVPDSEVVSVRVERNLVRNLRSLSTKRRRTAPPGVQFILPMFFKHVDLKVQANKNKTISTCKSISNLPLICITTNTDEAISKRQPLDAS